eukprot:2903185-Amphidinium_carterae.1
MASAYIDDAILQFTAEAAEAAFQEWQDVLQALGLTLQVEKPSFINRHLSHLLPGVLLPFGTINPAKMDWSSVDFRSGQIGLNRIAMQYLADPRNSLMTFCSRTITA